MLASLQTVVGLSQGVRVDAGHPLAAKSELRARSGLSGGNHERFATGVLYVEISREFFRPADESPDQVMSTFTLFPNAANANTTVRNRGQEAAAKRLSPTTLYVSTESR